MLICCYGQPGSGKTAFMSFAALQYKAKNFKIFSNYKIFSSTTKEPWSQQIISRGDLDRAKSGYLFLDELGLWMDSRFSASEQNIFVTGIMQKNRKRSLSLFFSCQDAWQVDVRLRENVDYVIMPEIVYKINGEVVPLRQNLFEPINTNLLLPYAWIRAYQIKGSVFYREKHIYKKDVVQTYEFPLAPIAGIYDTTEEIKLLADDEVSKGALDEQDLISELKEYYPPNLVKSENFGFNQYSLTKDAYLDFRDTPLVFDAFTPHQNIGEISIIFTAIYAKRNGTHTRM